MIRSIIKKGKSAEEAIEQGLAELGIDIENANVEILGTEDSLSVVKITEHISDEKKIGDFLETVMEYIGAEGELNISHPDEETIKVNVTGEKSSGLIGKRGDTLYAISYLANVIVNKDKEVYKRVIVDCEDYRIRKEEKLVELANDTAAKVCKFRRPVQLQPMPAAERRIIHATLQNNKMVETESFGVEPQRCVVVRLKPYTKVI